MITLEEINNYDLPIKQEFVPNLYKLHCACNEVRWRYGKPIVITSGVRNLDSHTAIYERINMDRLMANQPTLPIPYGSAHLKAAAVDMMDTSGVLHRFVREEMIEALDEIGIDIYIEDRKYTPYWVHMQVIPPKSGNRIFIP